MVWGAAVGCGQGVAPCHDEVTANRPMSPPTAEFRPVPSSLAAVRAFIRESCPGLDDFDLLRLIIVANELATNAVQHARSRYTVELITLVDAAVRVQVHDDESAGPQLPEEPSREGGRGLVIVDRLVRSWGTKPREGGGKTVWAELETPSLGN
jgi:anti-sigma regulatory factor (Ser/Thr protein kinase)